jgi:hypothetical protein
MIARHEQFGRDIDYIGNHVKLTPREFSANTAARKFRDEQKDETTAIVVKSG